MGAVAVDVMSL